MERCHGMLPAGSEIGPDLLFQTRGPSYVVLNALRGYSWEYVLTVQTGFGNSKSIYLSCNGTFNQKLMNANHGQGEIKK